VRKLVSLEPDTLSDTKAILEVLAQRSGWVKSEFDKYALSLVEDFLLLIIFTIKADGRRIAKTVN
jgi:hypothetical protein